jgi:hypothetical protein
MAQAPEATGRFRRRLLGYDRHEVEHALEAGSLQLRLAQDERDELLASSANVERIGAQVADMLRSLADRAVELEVEAAAAAEQVVQAARVEADGIRAQATAVLAAAEARAADMQEASRQRQAAVSRRRETAVTALHVAMDQIRRLTGSIESVEAEVGTEEEPHHTPTVVAADLRSDPAADDRDDAESVDTVVLLPWSGARPAPASEDSPAEPPSPPPEAAGHERESASDPADDPLATVLARFNEWANSNP